MDMKQLYIAVDEIFRLERYSMNGRFAASERGVAISHGILHQQREFLYWFRSGFWYGQLVAAGIGTSSVKQAASKQVEKFFPYGLS